MGFPREFLKGKQGTTDRLHEGMHAVEWDVAAVLRMHADLDLDKVDAPAEQGAREPGQHV
jgi:hypothetical protein